MSGSSCGAMTSPFDLLGRVAVVTGARRGVGLAMAEALARAGADIVGVSAGMEPSGSEVERRVHAAGRRFTPLRADLADRRDVRRLIGEINALGPIDILVNNAGTIARSPGRVHRDGSWNHAIEVHLTTQFVLSREIGLAMVRRGRGKIILAASLLSSQDGINVPAYSASTSGLAELTKALANEWAGRGVNVNAIAPGYIATDDTEEPPEDQDRNPSTLARIPAGRWGRADDLGGATVFLAAPASDYVNGVILPVDGGWLGR
jgi:2-deoxy-D-gluconate 3-dehydrogenase